MLLDALHQSCLVAESQLYLTQILLLLLHQYRQSVDLVIQHLYLQLYSSYLVFSEVAGLRLEFQFVVGLLYGLVLLSELLDDAVKLFELR